MKPGAYLTYTVEPVLFEAFVVAYDVAIAYIKWFK